MSSDRKPHFLRKPAVILSPEQLDKRRVALAALVERNKTRRRRDGDPPAAQPAPVEPGPKRPPLAGGAALALEFED